MRMHATLSCFSLIVTTHLLAIASPAIAFVRPIEQFASVGHRFGDTWVEDESDSELGQIDLFVGQSFNEASIQGFVHPLGFPFHTVHVSTFVSAESSSGLAGQIDDRYSEALYRYRFELLKPASYAINYQLNDFGEESIVTGIKQGDDYLVTLQEEGIGTLSGRFEPGEYQVDIQVTGFSPQGPAFLAEQEGGELSFGLSLMPIPEPSSILLLCFAIITLPRRIRISC